jgi:hypothetical protein
MIMKKKEYIRPMLDIVSVDAEQLLVVSTDVDGNATDPARAPEILLTDDDLYFMLFES